VKKQTILGLAILLGLAVPARADYCSDELTRCLWGCQQARDWASCNADCSRQFAACRRHNRDSRVWLWRAQLQSGDLFQCYASCDDQARQYRWTRERHMQCIRSCDREYGRR
jgi:hypothetical protein